MNNYKVGDRVQYISQGDWKPIGTVKKVSPAVIIGTVEVTPEMYKVTWDKTKEDSGWLKAEDLTYA